MIQHTGHAVIIPNRVKLNSINRTFQKGLQVYGSLLVLVYPEQILQLIKDLSDKGKVIKIK